MSSGGCRPQKGSNVSTRCTRCRRRRAAGQLPKPIQNYESQQAPLYYWLFAIPLRWMGSLPLLSRVYLLRILSLVLASLAIPLMYWIARQVLGSEAQAMGATAIVVLLPELMINVARVGNECLALLCYTTMLAAAVKVLQRPLLWRGWLLLGAALGCGLLTKAYFLTAVPAVVAVAVIVLSSRNPSDAQRPAIATVAVRFSAALAMSVLIAGRWYAHVHSMTGSWSGLAEDAALRQVSRVEQAGGGGPRQLEKWHSVGVDFARLVRGLELPASSRRCLCSGVCSDRIGDDRSYCPSAAASNSTG